MCTLVSISKSLGWGQKNEVGINHIIVAKFRKSTKTSNEDDDVLSTFFSNALTESSAMGTMSIDLNSMKSSLVGDDWDEKFESAAKKFAFALTGKKFNEFEDNTLICNTFTDKVNVYEFSVKSLLEVDANEVKIASTGRVMRTRLWVEPANVSEEQAFTRCSLDARKQLARKNWLIDTEEEED